MSMKSIVFNLVLKYMDNIRMHRDISVLKHIYHTSYLLSITLSRSAVNQEPISRALQNAGGYLYYLWVEV